MRDEGEPETDSPLSFFLQMTLIQQNVIQNKFLIFHIHMVQRIQNLVHSGILLSITFGEKIRQKIFQPDIQFVTEQTEHLERGQVSAGFKPPDLAYRKISQFGQFFLCQVFHLSALFQSQSNFLFQWKKKNKKQKNQKKKFYGHLFAFDGHFGYKEEKCDIVQKK